MLTYLENLKARPEIFAKAFLYMLAALLPLWFVPLPMGIDLGREITFGILTALSAVAWLLGVLTKGLFRIRFSPALYTGALLLVFYFASVFLSGGGLLSAVFSEISADKATTVLMGLVLLFLVGSVFDERKEVGRWILTLVAAGGLASVLSFLKFLGMPVYGFLGSFTGGVDFNAVGTSNALSLFYLMLLLMSVGLLVSKKTFDLLGIWGKVVVFLSAAGFVANILLINFRTSWIILFGAGVVLFGLIFRVGSTRDEVESEGRFTWRTVIVIALLVLALTMLIVQSPVYQVPIAAEVMPSFQGTLGITSEVYKEGILQLVFGSGPGSFALDWDKYKDPSINQTQFWGARFSQGFSWFSTLLATVGVAGTLAFLLFIAVSVAQFLPVFLLKGERDDTEFAVSSFLGLLTIAISFFLYPAYLTMVLALFLSAGLTQVLKYPVAEEAAQAVLAEESAIAKVVTFLRGGTRTFRLESPTSSFLVSLVVIVFVSLGVAVAYFEIGRLRAALLREEGKVALQQGDFEAALEKFVSAPAFEEKNAENYGLLVRARTVKLRKLLERAVQGENVATEVRDEVSRATEEAQRAVDLRPLSSSLWQTRGLLYELMIPYIQGSEIHALASFAKNTELEPRNPQVWLDRGRVGVLFADRLQLLGGQVGSESLSQIEEARFSSLGSAEEALKRAVELKSDFSPAHFLLSQIALRRGDLAGAIERTEHAKNAAPGDIGIIFQLGYLYYQNSNLDRAEAEFAQAVALNPQYSNARYFLGLIYDRRGKATQAIEQFKIIEEFNPGNKEVRRILDNLNGGKSALLGIAFPDESRGEE